MSRLEEVTKHHKFRHGEPTDVSIVRLLSEISVTLAIIADRLTEESEEIDAD